MDAATIGGIVISSFLQVLFDRIVPTKIPDFLRNFFRDKKLDELRSDLHNTSNAIKKLIQDAEDKQSDDLRVRQWLQKLQEAEDLLDAVNTEAMQIKQEQSNTRKRPRFFFSANTSPDSSPASRRLRKEPSLSQEELNRRVEAFIKKFNEEMRLQRQESLNQYKEMMMIQ